MIEITLTYKDLSLEIEMLEIRIDDLDRERGYLIHTMYHNAPRFNGVVDYSKDNVQNGYVPMTLDRIVERIKEIDNAIDHLYHLVDVKKRYLQKMESMLDQFEGLEYQVAYRRDLKGMKLQDIADELGKSHEHIRRISSRINKFKNAT